jgi:hypothetical protein
MFRLRSKADVNGLQFGYETGFRCLLPWNIHRWFFIQLYRWFPSILKVLTIIRPDTLVRWHRAGFRGYWRWKSRSRGGWPRIETDLCLLIRRMSVENPLRGAQTALVTWSKHERRRKLNRSEKRSVESRPPL